MMNVDWCCLMVFLGMKVAEVLLLLTGVGSCGCTISSRVTWGKVKSLVFKKKKTLDSMADAMPCFNMDDIDGNYPFFITMK